jgi:nitrite reductase/ring-hydroxylating ferredoxin subunit
MTMRIEIPAAQVPLSGARNGLQAAGKSLAIFNVDGTLYAIDDSCPHQGASLLGGNLQGRMIQCRAHGLRFDLATGCLANVSNYGVTSYPVEISEDKTFVHFPDLFCAESGR